MNDTSIADKIDKLLEQDVTFSTRLGVRFLTEVIRDAYKYIEQIQTRDEADRQQQTSIVTRLGNVENGLNDFLKMRGKEQEKAEDERKFYRRAVIGGILSIALSELARWLLVR